MPNRDVTDSDVDASGDAHAREANAISIEGNLEATAVLVVRGELGVPFHWRRPRLHALMCRVHELRRRRLICLFARAIAGDLRRRRRQGGDDAAQGVPT